MTGPLVPPIPSVPLRTGRAVLPLAAWLLVCSGCLDNPGVDPPEATLPFPIAMDLRNDTVYVAGANFDLRYNAGLLHAYDADVALECAAECRIGDGCVIVPAQADASDADDLVLRAEPCEGLLTGETLLGSFASGLQVNEAADRVYLTSRSEADLSHLDTDAEGRLACGGDPGTRHRCTEPFRTSDHSLAEQRGLSLPLDPVGVHVGPLDELAPGSEGTYAVVAHRDNAASLFVDFGDRPILVDVVRDLVPVPEDQPSANVENVLWHSNSQLAWLPTSANGMVGRVGVVADPEDPTQSFLFDAGFLQLQEVVDTRDVAFDPRPGLQRAYVLAREPQVLLRLDLGAGDRVVGQTKVQLCSGGGPSRIELTSIEGRMVAFVSCFDSGQVQVIDVDRDLLLNTTRGGQGPFVMSVDPTRNLLFIGDFINGTVEMLSLEPLAACLRGEPGTECAPEQHAVIGIPRPVETL